MSSDHYVQQDWLPFPRQERTPAQFNIWAKWVRGTQLKLHKTIPAMIGFSLSHEWTREKSKLTQPETSLLAPALLLFPSKNHMPWEADSCGSLHWAQSPTPQGKRLKLSLRRWFTHAKQEKSVPNVCIINGYVLPLLVILQSHQMSEARIHPCRFWYVN